MLEERTAAQRMKATFVATRRRDREHTLPDFLWNRRNPPCGAEFTVTDSKQGFFFVQNQADKQEIAELETLNAELMRSLARCRRFLFDGRSQLAANCNMPEMLDADPDATNA